jgi:hypothetical protein
MTMSNNIPQQNNNKDPHALNDIPFPFTVCCWNACSLLAHAPSVQLFLLETRPCILIIIEPMVNSPDRIPSFPQYSTVYVPHTNNHPNGGLVIYFHTSIMYQQHTTTLPVIAAHTATTIALFHISSKTLPRPFLLMPVYISSQMLSHHWHDLTQLFSGTPRKFTPARDMPTLIIGDMNARDPMWDNQHSASHSNAAGHRLSNFLSHDNDWHLLNLRMHNIKPTYFPRTPGHEPSVIDLAIANDFNIVESLMCYIITYCYPIMHPSLQHSLRTYLQTYLYHRDIFGTRQNKIYHGMYFD